MDARNGMDHVAPSVSLSSGFDLFPLDVVGVERLDCHCVFYDIYIVFDVLT